MVLTPARQVAGVITRQHRWSCQEVRPVYLCWYSLQVKTLTQHQSKLSTTIFRCKLFLRLPLNHLRFLHLSAACSCADF